jgi:hypothetical protein
MAAFMEQAAGHALDDEDLVLARAVHEETEGNPFFVREVLRHLTATGAVEQRQGRWGARLPVEQLGIPESVRDVVGRRLSRLSQSANQALRTAAVVGPEFELPVVQAAGGFDQEALLSALEEATEARLVVEATTRRYRFAHALVRDSLYAQLSVARRVAVHQKVAEAIESLHADSLDDHLPALAHHWARASAPAADTARAVEYATRAGDRALAQLAHDEAVAYYGQALELLETAEADGSRRLELVISLGVAQRRAGDPSYRETLLRAAHLARALHDTNGLVRAALANNRGVLYSAVGELDHDRIAVLQAALDALGESASADRAQLLANLALELTWSAQRVRRVAMSDEALAIAGAVDDPAVLADVLAARFYTILAPATLHERLANTAELLEVANAIGDPAIINRATWLRCRAATEAGDLAEVDRCLEILEPLSAELPDWSVRWLVDAARAGRELLAGRLAEAGDIATGTLEIGRAAGQPEAALVCALVQTQILIDQGDLIGAERRLADLVPEATRLPMAEGLWAVLYCEQERLDDARRVLSRLEGGTGFADVPVNQSWLTALTSAAIACDRLGEVEGGRALFHLLVPYAEQFPLFAGTVGPCVSYTLALLARTCGDLEVAEARFRAAEAAHTRVGAPVWLARTRLEWARMLLTRRQPGDAERARDFLGQAVATARELGLGNVERRAVELLS